MTSPLALAVLLSVASAPEPGRAIAPQQASTTKTSLAVMPFSAGGIPEAFAVGVTEAVAAAAQETGIFDTISPKQLSSMLAFEKRKELLGGCVQEACFVQVAQMVSAGHLIAGQVTKAGDRITLILVLVDGQQNKAINRVSKDSPNAASLMETARQSTIVLLQPILGARQGYLKVDVNVPDAAITIDDKQRPEGVGQVIALAAGPHVLEVSKDGFFTTTADVFIRPSRVSVETVKLIPAKETIQAYESKASLMRWSAYGTAVLAIGSAIASGFFYGQASDDLAIVENYNGIRDIDRATASLTFADAQMAKDDFTTNQALYLGFLGGAIAMGATSAILWLFGEDPDRYEEFHQLSGVD